MFNADHSVINQKPTLSKHLKKSNDVVEIFHNPTTLKNSNSAMSSKHFKLDRQAKYVKKLTEPTQKIQEKSPSEHINHKYQIRDKENPQIKNPPQTLNYQSNTG